MHLITFTVSYFFCPFLVLKFMYFTSLNIYRIMRGLYFIHVVISLVNHCGQEAYNYYSWTIILPYLCQCHWDYKSMYFKKINKKRKTFHKETLLVYGHYPLFFPFPCGRSLIQKNTCRYSFSKFSCKTSEWRQSVITVA